jgi:hypothetical protein
MPTTQTCKNQSKPSSMPHAWNSKQLLLKLHAPTPTRPNLAQVRRAIERRAVVPRPHAHAPRKRACARTHPANHHSHRKTDRIPS